jgi:hypothetical protein
MKECGGHGKSLSGFSCLATMRQTPDKFPICAGARSAGRSHCAARSAANRHQNHCRSAQPLSLMGHKWTNLRRPKPTFVRYCPKADKMLRCVRLLKGENLLPSRNSAFGIRSPSQICIGTKRQGNSERRA